MGVNKLLFRTLEFFALLFVIPSACVLILDLEDRQLQRTTQAWDLLIQHAPGNSGKISALEYLNSEDCRIYSTFDPFFWIFDNIPDCGLSAFKWPKKKKELLQGIDLSEGTHGSPVYLDGINLQKGGLSQSNFSGVFMTNANLSNSFLFQARFSESILACSDFSNAHITSADFSESYMPSLDFRGSDLSFSDLSKGYLIGAKFESSDLQNTKFIGARLMNVSFSNAEMSGVVFSGADVSGVNFGLIPNRILQSEQSLGVHPLIGASSTGAYYNSKNPPLISDHLLGYFQEVDPSEFNGDCRWFEGLSYFRCERISIPIDHEVACNSW